MSDQYVFGLQFKAKDGSNFKENQLVIVDGESISSFSKLKEQLRKCITDPFSVQYLDDEDDAVPIDTEEEFKEFAKLAKDRALRGMLINLILESNAPVDHGCPWQPPTFMTSRDIQENVRRAPHLSGTDKQVRFEGCQEQACSSQHLNHHCCSVHQELQLLQLKSDLKMQILSEIKEHFGASGGQASSDLVAENIEYDKDSDGKILFFPDVSCHRKVRLLDSQKKLEKKEKLAEAKIDQRLEKLEMKKKKLLEKATLRTINRKPAIDSKSQDPKTALPCIISAIATKESLTLAKRVTVGKAFLHIWNVINDGTVTWTNVELRHTWSSPGLEPDELSIQCPALNPGQEGHVSVKFKAPKIVGPFLSYWHFFHQVDCQWQQFGHYVSVSGMSKLSRTASQSAAQTKECKKSKQEMKAFFEEAVLAKSGVAKETKVLNEECKIAYELQLQPNNKQLEASLASAEIAAEMAREAANAVSRRASGIQTLVNTKCSEMEKLNSCLDTVTESVQGLNLVDSGSDTDANNDNNNDESECGFFFVDVPSSQIILDKAVENQKSVKLPQTQINELKDLSVESDNINSSNTNGDNEKNEGVKQQQVENNLLTEERNPKFELSKQPETSVSAISNGETMSKEELSQEKLEEHQQPLSFPRLDPNVNYPVFPPRVSIYPPPHLTHQHSSAYPVFPPQNSSSHAIVFPPPPIIHQFTPSKINPPVHYPQIPTYPPMPGSSHPVPLISSTIPPTAIPSQTVMPPPSQMGPIQMNPVPMGGPFHMNPFRVYGYEHPSSAQSDTTANGISISTITTPGLNTLVVNSHPKVCPVPLPKQASEAASSQPPTANFNVVPKVTQGINTVDLALMEQLDKHKKSAESGVQILPPALVDGAITVAATAYSTAWNAISNLRHKEGEASEFDPVFENNMAVLAEMGFNNLERNARLLKRFNNDVSQVIGVMCATGGGEHMNID